ncbi:hypothetical protein V491_05611 [Pseudogymnoascus sp. VKM F-3775]|nr:hypothetical protein V491_05611 [Pseudogymnoascus sp. VKM F-3775]
MANLYMLELIPVWWRVEEVRRGWLETRRRVEEVRRKWGTERVHIWVAAKSGGGFGGAQGGSEAEAGAGAGAGALSVAETETDVDEIGLSLSTVVTSSNM